MEHETDNLRASHVWLYVRDIERSISFYQKVLGLELAGTFPHGALFRSGEILIGIHSEEADRRSKPGGTLIVLQTDDIGRSHEMLKKRGIKFLREHVQTEPFGSVADFLDPDGYLLEIWQPPRRPT